MSRSARSLSGPPPNLASFKLAAGGKTRIEGHTAVHKNACPIDVIGLIRCEEHSNSPNVFRFADAFVGNESHQRLVGILSRPSTGINRRTYCPWADAVDTDTVQRDFLGDAFHHHHNSAFGSRIVYVSRPGNGFVHRAHANYLAGGNGNLLYHSSALEFTNRRPCTEKLSSEIHPDDGVPLGQCHPLKWGILLEPGIVDEDVDGPEFFQHLGKHRFHFRLL